MHACNLKYNPVDVITFIYRFRPVISIPCRISLFLPVKCLVDLKKPVMEQMNIRERLSFYSVVKYRPAYISVGINPLEIESKIAIFMLIKFIVDKILYKTD
jgi:hypothetical protein